MQKVHNITVLSEDVVAQIAAGQVVERPASVLKELLENALDAEATEVTVRLTKGGIERISVIDTGTGIVAEQLALALTPHATSKLHSLDDLSSIHSFGFRGEALASIAQAAELVLQSKTKEDEFGAEINARTQEVTPIGMPTGTQVHVQELFKKHPARKKFLRAAQTEYRACLRVVEQFALAHPSVTFHLYHNEVLTLSCTADEEETRIQQIWGDEYKARLLRLNTKRGLYTVSGYIATPENAQQHNQHQLLLVNNRIVSNQRFSQQIKAAFSSLLAAKKFPSFVVRLTAPPELIDVNVDPKKSSVLFAEEQMLLSMLTEVVQEVLSAHNLRFGADTVAKYPYFMDRGIGEYIQSKTALWSAKDLQEQGVLQINNLYLLAPTREGLLLIDQHAAHERILYDQLRAQFEKEQKQVRQYMLDESVTLHCSRSEVAALQEHHSLFSELGFALEQVGETTLLCTAIPEYLRNGQVKQFIQELLSAVLTDAVVPTESEIIHRTLAYVACRAAIKAGEPLSESEKRNIVTQLQEVSEIYTCPHGRPVAVLLSEKALAKLFERA